MRVVVFLDEQNSYKDARSAFYSATHFHTYGKVIPIEYGVLLCQRLPAGWGKEPRILKEVRVYGGLPDPRRDPKGNAAASRQYAVWAQSSLVRVFARPLQYLPGEEPKQKGVDVSLAIDLVRMGVEDEFDIGIVASTDTDILPSIEYLLSRGKPIAEVACWWVPERFEKQLKVEGRRLWCHRLRVADCEAVADHRDYNMEGEAPKAPR
jgi:uncharacterized LabA/DUF88 family protein